MSLINDALKKAQRQRSQGTPDSTPTMSGDGGGRVAKRGAPMSAQTMVLIGVGAVALVVISAVSAVLFVNSGEKNRSKPAIATSTTAVSPTAAAPKTEVPANLPTAIVLPPLKKTAETEPIAVATPAAAPAPAPAPVETRSAPKASVPAIRSTTPLPEPVAATTNLAPKETAPTAPPETSAPTPPRSAAPDERVNTFLDALRITGVRSSGTDSRVLMNEKVFRVNDLVDRGLGLKLKVVASDHLTFIDANGVEYVKNF